MQSPTEPATLSNSQVSAYLARLDVPRAATPSLATLTTLHRAHLQHVPFENLDIHLGRPIVLQEASLYHKVVEAGRGGYCYELNGLFAALLRTLGFQVTLVSARVAREDGSLSPEFDHLALVVEADGPRLVDVGFGDAFLDPLPLQGEIERCEGRKRLRLEKDGDRWQFLEARDGENFKVQYHFTLIPRALSDFEVMNAFHQTSPDSHFRRHRIVTLARPEGRVTLRNDLLIETQNGRRRETRLAEQQSCETLAARFGIVLP